MQDRVPLYPGRVTLTPVAGQENTFDMVRADQPTQEGTPLNKASLLKDATAAMFGLTVDAVPDDVLKLLSRLHTHLGDEYLWRTQSISGVLKESTELISIGRFPRDVTIYYYDSVQMDLANKKIVGVGEHIIANQSYGSSEWDNIIGKYVFYPWSEYPWPANSFYRVTKRRSSSDSIFDAYIQYIEYTYGPIQYLNSPDQNGYPNGIFDGIQYDFLGKIGAQIKIQAGTYVGTDSYGETRKSSLTFGFTPKLVIVMHSTSSDSAFIYLGQIGNSSKIKFDLVDKTLSWYNANSAANQFNTGNSTYNYIAVGQGD